MKKFLSIGAAAAVALAVSLAAVGPSAADPAGDAIGAGIVGGMFGFMAGAAAASSPHSRVYVEDDYYLHVRACQRAYGYRYDEDTDTYRARNGRRYYCDL